MMIKLVIWDLDETFWHGTLSEGKVLKNKRNIELVKKFVDRGIMNSIVSKNSPDDAMSVLKEWGIADYFIFPQISWEAKGNRVKKLLEECNLRAANCIFVDDNISNLEEVRFYNPGMLCVSPDYLERDILAMEDFQGKEDLFHTRLKEYKVLEERAVEKQNFASNEEFLRASNIRIRLCRDCRSQTDRISELIQRTNQLNYTKNRMNLYDLKKLLDDPETESAYVQAWDNFGEYGIVGFYALKDHTLIHYLFSCRILGFGIENYIYKYLGCPDIETVGETAVVLDKKKIIDWITVEDNDGEKKIPKTKDDRRAKLLFIGGCDLEQASRYLETDFEIKKEFATIINGHEIRTSDTSQLIYSKEMKDEVKEELCENLFFMDKSVTFSTDLYTGEYRVIVISLVDDFIRGVYRHKDGTYCITYGNYWNPEEILENVSDSELQYFKENFTFVGREDVSVFRDNIEKIIKEVQGCRLIFINGIDLDVSDWIGEDRCLRNKEMNLVIDEVIREHPDIGLVDMRKIVVDQKALTRRDNRHFDRKTYYLMAKEIIRLCEPALEEGLQAKSITAERSEELIKKIKNKLIKWGGGILSEKIENADRLYILGDAEFADIGKQPDSTLRLKKITLGIARIVHENAKYMILVDNEVKRTNLEKIGLIEFDDFVYEEFIRKKMAVFYGNCHMVNLADLLGKFPAFSEYYAIYPMEGICDIKDPEYFNAPVFKNCDLFIHQSIRKNNRYGEEYASENIIALLHPRCRVISVPNVYHMPMCFFPQYMEKRELKDRKGGTLFFRDRIIEEGIMAGKSVAQIVRDYHDPQYFSESEIKKLEEVFIDKIKYREKDWDIKITGFFFKEMPRKRLFYDPNHPVEDVIKYIALQLMRILEIEFSYGDLENLTTFKLDSYEMPICRAVSDYFGFSYNLDSVELRDTGRKIYTRKMGLEEYIRQYLSLLWEDSNFSANIRAKSYVCYCRYSLLESKRRIFRKISKAQKLIAKTLKSHY